MSDVCPPGVRGQRKARMFVCLFSLSTSVHQAQFPLIMSSTRAPLVPHLSPQVLPPTSEVGPGAVGGTHTGAGRRCKAFLASLCKPVLICAKQPAWLLTLLMENVMSHRSVVDSSLF